MGNEFRITLVSVFRSSFFGITLSILFLCFYPLNSMALPYQQSQQLFTQTAVNNIPRSQALSLNRPIELLIKIPDVKVYQNTVVKHNRLNNQLIYMKTCMINGCIPKGISDQAKFRLSFPNALVHENCQKFFYFAASRASDVIRTHLKVSIEKLRQRIFNLDSNLRKSLSTKEFETVVSHTSVQDLSVQSKQHEIHNKKLKRDLENSKFYIPYKKYYDPRKQKKNRRFKAKHKLARKPSRRVKRRSLRSEQSTPASQTTSSLAGSSTSAPPAVINLSSTKILTEGHIGIFQRGPKFVPTPPKADLAEFQKDYVLWKNRLRWAYHHQFGKLEKVPVPVEAIQIEPSQEAEDSPNAMKLLVAEKGLCKEKKSQYSAPLNQNHALELFLHKLDLGIKDHKERTSSGDNLTKEERAALKDIRSWSDVIVRPYDKGIGYIVDDVVNYEERVKKEILDPQNYKVVEDAATDIVEINSRIKDWVEKYPESLSDKLRDWIVNENATCGYYYMLYKAHKPEKGYPGRLITSACGSPTEHLSQWIEFHLGPLMDTLPYRIKDSSHFHRNVHAYNAIRKTQDDPKTIIHCSWDIEKMYPNILNDLGIKSCTELLDKRPENFPSTESIIEAIKITLEENIAQFGDIVTKQTEGTAMGPSHACSYADTAADYAVDQKVMSNSNEYLRCISLWNRLRDDIYCAWTGTEEELKLFDKWLNELHPRLKFTLEYSTEGTIFLDLFVSTGTDNCLKTKIYSKPCDSHAYLLPTSCHPAHICKNIPIGVMKRLRRNCSDDTDFKSATIEYSQYLKDRQYNESVIQEAIKSAKDCTREDLIGINRNGQNSSNSSNNKYPLVIKFNQKLPPMAKIIRDNLHVLELTNESRQMFNDRSLFVSYKMESNIKSLICKNKYIKMSEAAPNETIENNHGCFSCTKCTFCKNFLVEGNSFTSPNIKNTFNIKSRISCQNENIIYVIYDKICEKIFYVGYTCDTMRVRWANHKSHIKNCKKSCELSTHFTKHNLGLHKLDKTTTPKFTASLKEHLSIILIERVDPIPGKSMKEACEIRETYWQGALKASRLFGGINKRTNRT